MKTLKVVRALSLAFISVGAGYTPYAVADKMKSTSINVSGYIEAETCSAIKGDDGDIKIELEPIPLATMKSVSSIHFIKNTPVKVEFSCPSGLYANMRLKFHSPLCVTPGGTRHSCGGENKTVGIGFYLSYLNFDKNNELVRTFMRNGVDQLYKVGLDEKKQGVILVGDEISLGRVHVNGETLPVEPGAISADYTLELWVD